MKSFKTFLEGYKGFKRTYHRPTSPPKQPNYNKSMPKERPEEPEIEKPKTPHWLDKAKAEIESPEHVERLRKIIQRSKD